MAHTTSSADTKPWKVHVFLFASLAWVVYKRNGLGWWWVGVVVGWGGGGLGRWGRGMVVEWSGSVGSVGVTTALTSQHSQQ